MSGSNSIQYNLNRFFKEIQLKKQYLKKMQNKVSVLGKLKEENSKKVNSKFFTALINFPNTVFIIYVIDISFSKKNILFHVSDFLGNIKFFYSAGSFQQKGKEKATRAQILKKFLRTLVSKLKFVKKVPIAIHLKNMDPNTFWFLEKLKKRLFITVIKHFNPHSFNGCRKKKIRRKKFKDTSLIL